MREIPILFSTPMVQAILEGRKTQTRRVIKPQPQIVSDYEWHWGGTRPKAKRAGGAISSYGVDAVEHGSSSMVFQCPYGKLGDLLWVRETWGYSPGFYQNDAPWNIIYRADGDDQMSGLGRWYPSIHMKKENARIWLEVVSVRVERLHNMDYKDALAEGIFHHAGLDGYVSSKLGTDFHCSDPTISFMKLWCDINGPESWDANPWVWVVEFKKVKTPA